MLFFFYNLTIISLQKTSYTLIFKSELFDIGKERKGEGKLHILII